MDLEFTDEQVALRESVRDLLDQECPPSAVRELAEKGPEPERLWPAQVETGWPALAVPETAGGLGLGPVELSIVAEECGRVVAPGPWFPTATQFTAAVAATATAEQAAAILGPVAEGTATGTLAVSEDPSGALPSVVSTVGRRLGGGWSLRGVKQAVLRADGVDEIAVVASVETASADHLAVFVIPTESLDIRPVRTMDRTRSWSTVRLNDVLVPDDRALGVSMDVEAGVGRALDIALVALAAETVGSCAAIVDRTVAYAKQREQFGVPIGSFQAIKHKLADDYLAVERARATVYYAALTIAEDAPDRVAACAMAKIAAGDCQRRVVEDGIQTHGGIGYTWEHDLHLWGKRAMSSAALLGGAAAHRARLADVLGLPVVSGS